MSEDVEDEECIECGFPELDGLWYDGRCDECHDISIENSIILAIRKMEEDKS